MMNLIQVQDNLKNFSQDQLIKEMQQPSGNTPQFLVLSELNRRKRVKGDFEARQAQNQPTVAEEAVASAGVPQSGMMGMSEAMAPQSAVSEGVGTSAPMKMASGGLAQFGNEIRNSMGQEIDPYLDGVQQEAESKFNVDLNNNEMGSIQQLPGPRIPSINDELRPAIMRPFNPGMGGKGMPRPAVMPRPMRGGPEMFSQAFGARRNYAEGGVIRAANGLSLADRNMNPGNIRPAGFMGETGVNSGYSTYASPEFGLRAMSKLSDTYSDKGIGTVRDYINRYAPPSDNNENNEAYANMVAQALGVGVDDPVDFKNPEVKKALIPAMAQFEGYKGDLSPELINQGIAAGGTTDVTKANELLSGVDSFDPSNLFGINKRKVVGTTTTNTTNNKVSEDDKDRVDGRGFVKKLFDIVPTPDDSLSGFEGSEKGNVPQFYKDIQKQLEQREENKKENESPEKIINEPKSMVGDDFDTALDIYNKKEEERVDGRNKIDKFFNKIPEPEDSPPAPEKKFLFGQKGIDILKEGQKKRLAERKLIKDKFYFPEDSLSGMETFNMDSPAEASDEVKKQTEEALKKGVVDANKTKPEGDAASKSTTVLSSLEQELLNRQDQMKKDRDFDKYMALAQAGLSIMSSDNPTLAGAIGEGGTSGLTAFRDANKRYQEGLNDILNARVKLANKKGGLTQKDAITAISSIDSDIASLMKENEKSFDEATKKQIADKIAQLEFQKEGLMTTAGYSRLSRNVSDSASKS